MLGRLATWMRAAGYDVSYARAIDDNELIKRAIEQDRIILTRDTLLIKRRVVRDRYFFIHSDDYRVQLKEVIGKYDFNKKSFLTRCLRCNAVLVKVEKEFIKEHVPPYVFSTCDIFSKCPDCSRIYWGGTHRQNMLGELETIAAM